ncbi:MAG: hypothetical protein IPJ68_05910 [Candidatus Moraniibacteriota bacterium]|nr:MAG: hypothetical protein IPJ68_05910 [Candidatus Moranbacteria bacterium]
MAEGAFYSGGMHRFEKEEHPAPKGVELAQKDYDQKLGELRAGNAAEVVRKYKIGKVVEDLLNHYTIDDFTPEFCEEFVRTHEEVSDCHPALIRAVAEEIMKERDAQDTRRSTKH